MVRALPFFSTMRPNQCVSCARLNLALKSVRAEPVRDWWRKTTLLDKCAYSTLNFESLNLNLLRSTTNLSLYVVLIGTIRYGTVRQTTW